MRLFAGLGLEIAITELDVRVPDPPNSTDLEMQSKVYEESVGACVQVDECVGVTVWDFYDPVSSFPFHLLSGGRRIGGGKRRG